MSIEIFFGDPQGGERRVDGAPAFFDDPKVIELVLALTSIADETTRSGILSIMKDAAALHHSRTLDGPQKCGVAD
ncbi:hypothetical protein [Methylobacterium sp. CM6257]